MRIRDREWRAENDDSAFPFEDRATLTSARGAVILDGTFLDASIYPAGSSSPLYITKLVITGTTVNLYVGDVETEDLCAGSFSLLSPPDIIQLLDQYARPAGLLVSETLRLAAFQAWPTGEHLFTVDDTPFVAAVCTQLPVNHVQGFLLGTDVLSLAAGDIWLVGGDGIMLSYREVTEPDGTVVPVIRADAVGEPLFLRKKCTSPGLFESPRFLRRLIVQKGLQSRTVDPTSQGDIQISVGSQSASDTVLRISPTADGLTIKTVGEQLQTLR